jgi:hypothetical protein
MNEKGRMDVLKFFDNHKKCFPMKGVGRAAREPTRHGRLMAVAAMVTPRVEGSPWLSMV